MIDLLGDGISHLDLLGVDSSSSQLLREGVLISEAENLICKCVFMSVSHKLRLPTVYLLRCFAFKQCNMSFLSCRCIVCVYLYSLVSNLHCKLREVALKLYHE